MKHIHINDIYNALTTLQSNSDSLRVSGNSWQIRERAEQDYNMAQRAIAEYNEIQKHWREFNEYMSTKERDYDRYVTTDRCCSCHISAPCNFCIEQSQEDEPVATA